MATNNSISRALDAVSFNADGLIPAVAQQRDTGEVLMLAWMNREAIAETVRTGEVHYWSRSRNALWHKGETSGQVQKLVDMRLDCDSDTLLLVVDQTGVACHTGRRTCFYRSFNGADWEDVMRVEIDPATLYGGG